MAPFPPDWEQLFRSLSSHGVRFLIVGAHALAANGRPRATQDIDVLVEPSLRNAQKLGRALREFGFEALAAEWREFAQADRMATLGSIPLRIDLLTSISGVSFREAWKGRLRSRVGEHEIGFLGLAELKRNKLAAGRTKDLLDLALLEEVEERR